VTLASRGDSYGFGCGGGWFAGCGGQGGGLVVLVNRGREGGGTMALNDSHGAWRNRGSGRGWGRAGARFGCEEDRGVRRVDVCSSKQIRSIA